MLQRSSFSRCPGGSSTTIRAAIEKAIGYLSEHPDEARYTDSRHPDFAIDSLLAWEPVVMGVRLAEPIPSQLSELTRRDLDRALAGDSQLHGTLRDCRVAA